MAHILISPAERLNTSVWYLNRLLIAEDRERGDMKDMMTKMLQVIVDVLVGIAVANSLNSLTNWSEFAVITSSLVASSIFAEFVGLGIKIK